MNDNSTRTGSTRPFTGGYGTVPIPRANGRAGLPTDNAARSRYMHELAKQDVAEARLAAAENNLRLALAFDPHNHECALDLEHVIKARRELEHGGTTS